MIGIPINSKHVMILCQPKESCEKNGMKEYATPMSFQLKEKVVKNSGNL